MPEDEDEEIDLKYCCPHCGAPQEAIILDKQALSDYAYKNI